MPTVTLNGFIIIVLDYKGPQRMSSSVLIVNNHVNNRSNNITTNKI